MPGEFDKLDIQDDKLLTIGGSTIIGGSGGWEAPPFGYSDRDYVYFRLYDFNNEYRSSGTIVDFKDNDEIRLKPGNEIRSSGAINQPYNVDYNFLDLIGSSGISQLTGSKTRLCVDKEGCISTQKEEQVCSVGVDVYTKKFERCGKEYVGIYDILDDSTLAILEEGSGDNPYLNIYFDDQESVYCDYCFDGVMNGDEESVDCGGSCKECGVEVYYEEEKHHWWDFLF